MMELMRRSCRGARLKHGHGFARVRLKMGSERLLLVMFVAAAVAQNGRFLSVTSVLAVSES